MAIRITAEARTEKNPRALRRQGFIPGVVYGAELHHPIKVSLKELNRALGRATRSTRFTLTLDGENYDTFLREIQYHPMNDSVLHVDFYRPRTDQVIEMDVPILLHGSPVGLKKGGTLSQIRTVLPVKGLMDNIPESIEVDISDMEVGSVLRVGDLDLTGVSVLIPLDSTIAFVKVPRRLEVLIPELAEEEAADEAAEEAADEAAAEADDEAGASEGDEGEDEG